MQPIPVILQINSRSSKDLTSLRQCAFIYGGLLIHARRECKATLGFKKNPQIMLNHASRNEITFFKEEIW
jgi:hypothetical protein